MCITPSIAVGRRRYIHNKSTAAFCHGRRKLDLSGWRESQGHAVTRVRCPHTERPRAYLSGIAGKLCVKGRRFSFDELGRTRKISKTFHQVVWRPSRIVAVQCAIQLYSGAVQKLLFCFTLGNSLSNHCCAASIYTSLLNSKARERPLSALNVPTCYGEP